MSPIPTSVPAHYLDLLCCPACGGNLTSAAGLTCGGCGAVYPLVDGIPILMAPSEDAVSRSVAAFYEGAWKRGEDGELVAKRVHEDLSVYGQRYIEAGERRLRATYRGGDSPRFFLDAACGAQPRIALGESFQHHVCIDFSLDGLREARRLLGDRAVCAAGSLLRLPVKDQACTGVLASHCLYHIYKDLQDTALRELLRVLAPGATLLILYANPAPKNLVSRMARLAIRPVRWLRTLAGLRRANQHDDSPTPEFPPLYLHLHTVDHMKEVLSSDPGVEVAVHPLNLFSRAETEPAFRLFGGLAYRLVMLLERLHMRRPDWSYYLAYEVTRRGTDSRTTRRRSPPQRWAP